MEVHDTEPYKTDTIECHNPDLNHLCKIIGDTLKQNFQQSSCDVVDCPDLTKPPYRLAAQGLCGNPSIADVGGIPNIVPTFIKGKHYDVNKVVDIAGVEGGLVIGAGAAPFSYHGCNAEWVCNIQPRSKEQSESSIHSHLYSVDPTTKAIHKLSCDTSRFDVLGNLFCSDGLPGKVIRIKAKGRTSDQSDFSEVIRSSLIGAYPGEIIALGGLFVVETGEARCHVMPRHYSTTPLMTDTDVDQWLNYYNLPAPLTFVGILVSHDPGYQLRMSHFHGYNMDTKQGGHYHNDVTGSEVTYEAYFNIAARIYRMDQCYSENAPVISY